jgi:hypothetical protein
MVQRGLPLKPYLVLLTFSENDVSDLMDPMWLSLAENRRRKSQFPLRYLYPVLRQTAIWNFALKVRATLAAAERQHELEGGSDEARDTVTIETMDRKKRERKRGLRGEYARRLSDLSRSLSAARIPFLFVLYPSHHSILDPERRELLHWAEQTGRSLGIDTISLFEVLEAAGKPMDALYLLPEDGHPSPLGYEVAAADLLRRVDWATYSGGACSL